jgi:transposase
MKCNIVQDYAPPTQDLNPVECVWGLLKISVSKRNPAFMQYLEAIIQEEWGRSGKELLNLKVLRV